MKLAISEITESEQMHYQVFCDNRDISESCFAFDSEQGWADVYVFTQEGRILTTDSGVVAKRIHGKIDIYKGKERVSGEGL